MLSFKYHFEKVQWCCYIVQSEVQFLHHNQLHALNVLLRALNTVAQRGVLCQR